MNNSDSILITALVRVRNTELVYHYSHCKTTLQRIRTSPVLLDTIKANV
jgi:hypothetical protein